IWRWVAVDLPRMPGGLPPIRRHPFPDGIVRLTDAMVRAAVDGHGSLARLRFGRVHLARCCECARDLDTEFAQHRRGRSCRVVIEKNVVAIGPQAWLAANELPDLVQGRPPGRANGAPRDLAPHRGQLPGNNGLQDDRDGHSSIVDQNLWRRPSRRWRYVPDAR